MDYIRSTCQRVKLSKVKKLSVTKGFFIASSNISQYLRIIVFVSPIVLGGIVSGQTDTDNCCWFKNQNFSAECHSKYKHPLGYPYRGIKNHPAIHNTNDRNLSAKKNRS